MGNGYNCSNLRTTIKFELSYLSRLMQDGKKGEDKVIWEL